MKTQKILAVLLTLVMVLSFASCALADAEDARKSVVRIYAENEMYYSIGSGFCVGEKGKPVEYIVTNRHVLDMNDNGKLEDNEKTGYVITNDASTKRPANVIAQSNDVDLIVLKLLSPLENREPMAIRAFAKDELNSRTNVYALGFPDIADYIKSDGAYGQLNSNLDQISVSNGIVNRIIDRAETSRGEQIQHNALINGGNSGGPLVDEKGSLIGVNTMVYAENSHQASAVYYAISSNEVIRLLKSGDVPYFTPNSFDPIMIAIIAVAVVLVVVVILLIMQGQKSKKPGKAPASSNRNLVGESGAMAGKSIPLKGKMLVGRDNEKAAINFRGTKGVSHNHCMIQYDGQKVTVTDIGSSFGTFIDGQKLPVNQPVTLHRGHKLQIGNGNETFTLHS